MISSYFFLWKNFCFTGNGFYLYSKEQMQIDGESQCNGTGPKNVLHESEVEPPFIVENLEEEETPVQVIIVSLWYWWYA